MSNISFTKQKIQEVVDRAKVADKESPIIVAILPTSHKDGLVSALFLDTVAAHMLIKESPRDVVGPFDMDQNPEYVRLKIRQAVRNSQYQKPVYEE